MSKTANHTIWTPEKIASLKSLYADGLSLSRIAHKPGPEFSRCAVSGKAWRIGIATRKENHWKGPQRAPAPRKPRLVVAPPPPVELVPAIGEPETLLDSGQCKFIAGDVRFSGWRMCGHPTGSITNPWCPTHRAICFEKAKTAASIKRSVMREADAAQDRMMRKVGLG